MASRKLVNAFGGQPPIRTGGLRGKLCLFLCVLFAIFVHYCGSLKQVKWNKDGEVRYESAGGKTIIVGSKEFLDGQEVHAFKGLPFATVSKRFSFASFKETLDEGIIYAKEFKPACPQPTTMITPDVTKISEDCLYLNIWISARSRIKAVNEHVSLSVIVLFYGGGFNIGAGSQARSDGSALSAHEDVIVVSFNYRTGSFGFLDLGTQEAPGNVGLMDQLLALKWVNKHIRLFGGDPNKVTVMGSSAGAISLGVQLTRRESRDYFQRAIYDGGNGFIKVLKDSSEGKAKAFKLAQALNYASSRHDIAGMLEYLRQQKIEDIIQAQIKLNNGDDTGSIFVPTYNNIFLPQNPVFALQEGYVEGKVPSGMLLLSHEEGSMFLLSDYWSMNIPPNIKNEDEFYNVLKKYIPRFVLAIMWSKIKELYVPTSTSDYTQAAMDVFGDAIFVCSGLHFADSLSRLKTNVSVIQYSYRSNATIYPSWMGVHHTAAYNSALGHPFKLFRCKAGEQDLNVSRAMMNMVATFANTGKTTYIGKFLEQYNVTSHEQPLNEVSDEKYLKYHKYHPRLKYCCDIWNTLDAPSYCSKLVS